MDSQQPNVVEYMNLDSSNIKHLRYYPDAEVLTVTFQNESIWEYFAVTRVEVEAVRYPGDEFNGSIGRAFNDLIRGHKRGRQIQWVPSHHRR